MKDFTIQSSWRTPDVVAICIGMREAQEFSALSLSILADALQDADCDDSELLMWLRAGAHGYAADTTFVAVAMSETGAEAVQWLKSFADSHDCPGYEELFNAATGNHSANDMGDSYNYSESYDGYLHFGGSDAHGEIPDVFWDYVTLVSGKQIVSRAQYFSCSC